MGGCQSYGPFLGTLTNRCRIIIGTQKGTLILTTTQMRGLRLGEPDLGLWVRAKQMQRTTRGEAVHRIPAVGKDSERNDCDGEAALVHEIIHASSVCPCYPLAAGTSM